MILQELGLFLGDDLGMEIEELFEDGWLIIGGKCERMANTGI